MSTPLIDIRPADWQIVRTILEKHVPSYEVWAFGSRVRWETKDYSDLDLATITDHPLKLDVKSALDSDFAESDLPFKVDVVDWATASPSFREIIQRDKVVVQKAKQETGISNASRMSRIGDIARINPEQINGNWPYSHIRYIDISSVGEGRIETPPCWMKTQDSPSRAKRTVRKGDTVLSTVRPGRRSMFFASCPEDDWILSTGFAVLRPHPEYVDPRYLYYCVFDPNFTGYLLTREKGAAYPAVSPEDIANGVIRIPPIQDQRTIASILGTLDDKIELNRKMNETLEAMAGALFKSWFVDYDPVRAKAERRDPCLSKPLADLFPDSFIDSELGEIPKGWIVGPILKHARLLSGGTPKTDRPKYWNGNILWASAKDVSQCGQTFLITTERTITNKGLEESATQLIPALCAVVVARGATTGRMVLFGREMAMNQTCYALASTTSTPFFLYCQLRQETDALVTAAHGSVFDTITTSTFADSKVVLPQKPVLEGYEKMVSPLFLKILRNSEESATLTVLRDTLLPKLISGELRMKVAAECWQQMPDQQRMVY